MRNLVATLATTVALVVPLAVTSPASAAPLRVADLLTLWQAASVYPALQGGDRIRGQFGVVAPRSAVVRDQLKCDRYRSFKGTSRRNASFFDVGDRTSVTLDQDVIRLRNMPRAQAVLRHYRRYIRTCEGTHRTTDGEGGSARMKVRGWQTPRVGAGSVGMLVAFIQHGDTTWRRTVVARTGRTVTVQTTEMPRGKGSPERAIEISRKAVRKLN